jgi:hypothetical protein
VFLCRIFLSLLNVRDEQLQNWMPGGTVGHVRALVLLSEEVMQVCFLLIITSAD